MYHVNRSHLVFDEDVHICVADKLDNCSPGMLVATHDEEGEYDEALEAVTAAIALSERTGEVICLGSGNALGLYSSAESPIAPADLIAWAEAADELAHARREPTDDEIYGGSVYVMDSRDENHWSL